MKKLEEKWNGILYEGGYDNFSVNGYFHMEKEVLYKDNPMLESEKRLNMAYLLLTNPYLVEVIQKRSAHFFHGTNANAIANILKYGINSVDASVENGITVTTGEEWSRNQGKRNFVSVTDSLDEALGYANMKPKANSSANALLNFGVLIGTSFEDMKGLKTCGVRSDIPEVGVIGNLPVDHIKFLAVPEDKVEFIKKMVDQKDIEVVSMDMEDIFYISNFRERLSILEEIQENKKPSSLHYPTYFKEDVKPLVNERKTSRIKEVFEILKAKIRRPVKDDKNISERG